MVMCLIFIHCCSIAGKLPVYLVILCQVVVLSINFFCPLHCQVIVWFLKSRACYVIVPSCLDCPSTDFELSSALFYTSGDFLR